MAVWDGLAGVQREVEERALYFLGIEDSSHIARRANGNVRVAQFGTRARGFDDAAHALIDRSVYWRDIALFARQIAQGIEQFGHLIRRGLNFPVHFIPIEPYFFRFVWNFRVRPQGG